MSLRRQFLSNDRSDLALTQSRRPDQEAVVQPPMVLEGSVQRDSELVRHALLPDDMGK